MAFLYGAQDDRGRTVAETLFRSIKSNNRENKKGKDGENKQLSGTKPILKTRLIGSALFHKTLKTQEWITQEYIPLIMSKKEHVSGRSVI